MFTGKLFQAEVGLSQSWFDYEFKELNDVNSKFIPHLTLGINYRLYTLSDFSITAGLRYHDLFKYIDMTDYGYADGKLLRIDNYLFSIPFQIKYNVGFINTNVLLNFEPSYIVKSNIEAPSIHDYTNFEEREITDEMNQLQFSIGIGLEYIISIAKEKFGIKSVYNYGLTQIPKNGEFKYDSMTHTWNEYTTSELNIFLTYYF